MCGRCFEVTLWADISTLHTSGRGFSPSRIGLRLCLWAKLRLSDIGLYAITGWNDGGYAVFDNDVAPAEVGAEKRNADLMNRPARSCWDVPPEKWDLWPAGGASGKDQRGLNFKVCYRGPWCAQLKINSTNFERHLPKWKQKKAIISKTFLGGRHQITCKWRVILHHCGKWFNTASGYETSPPTYPYGFFFHSSGPD